MCLLPTYPFGVGFKENKGLSPSAGEAHLLPLSPKMLMLQGGRHVEHTFDGHLAKVGLRLLRSFRQGLNLTPVPSGAFAGMATANKAPR